MQLLAAPCCLCVVDERHACFVRDFECFPRCGSFSGVGWRARQSKQGVGFLVWLGKLRWCAPASEDGGVGVVAAGVGATVANPSCSWLEDSLQLLCRAGNGRGSGHAQGRRGVVHLLPCSAGSALLWWLCFPGLLHPGRPYVI